MFANECTLFINKGVCIMENTYTLEYGQIQNKIKLKNLAEQHYSKAGMSTVDYFKLASHCMQTHARTRTHAHNPHLLWLVE